MVDIRQLLGNAVDTVGGVFHIPETGISEWINKGQPTVNSASPRYVYASEGNTNLNNANNSIDQADYNEAVGSIQKVSQNPANQPIVNSSSGGGGTSGGSPASGFDMSKYPGWDPNAAYQDWLKTGGSNQSSGGGTSLSDYMRGQIESGYNDYFGQLNGLYGGLDTQAGANNQIAQNSYNQSIGDLQANKQSSLADIGMSENKLQNNQVKNLRDISNNIQNQYMAGNVMLGARGAGDSSAANQYSYALNRIGSKERGNVMNQTAQGQSELENQKAKLNNIVTQETSRLDTEFANTKQSISSWLAEQQNSIKQMIAEGTLKKSQDIAAATTNALNTAITLYQNKATEIQGKRSQLETWAMSNATKGSELANNMKTIAQYMPNMPSANAINGGVQVDSQGNLRSLFGYGTSDEDKLNY